MALPEIKRGGLDAQTLESVVVGGDLSKLTPAQRLAYYRAVCESLGLNPLTKPFDYILLNGRLTLYARKDATDQIRAQKGISIEITGRELIGDVYVVTARGKTADGRTDESIGAVSVVGLKGEPLANAYMKAETKAKRRVTLSLAGLGWLDETETETIPDAQRVLVTDSGEVLTPPKPATRGQLKTLLNVAEEVGLGKEGLLDWLEERYGTRRGSDLTSDQVEEAMRLLRETAEAADDGEV